MFSHSICTIYWAFNSDSSIYDKCINFIRRSICILSTHGSFEGDSKSISLNTRRNIFLYEIKVNLKFITCV